jgi:pimeloyl-ACP methyl ester carboxylesterase
MADPTPAPPVAEPAWLGGSIRAEAPGHSPLVVVVLRASPDAPPRARIVEHVTLEGEGLWGLPLPPGAYEIAAFADSDGDGACGDEPFLSASGDPLVLAPGERVEELALVVPADGRFLRARDAFDLAGLRARSPAEQERRLLEQCAVLGGLTTLGDPRFETPIGRMGLWRRVDFTLTQGPGIWFLEPYDPGRIPVLFVHGITGHPREFAALVEQLDARRFQPWFFFYPSGTSLQESGRLLASLLARLQSGHGFDRLAIVAHSMGGLVARAAVFEYEAATGRPDIRVCVSISAPVAGDAFAARGADGPGLLPMPPALRDLAAGSPFLAGLFQLDPDTHHRPRRLPSHVQLHLLYGYDNGGTGDSGDGVLTLAQMLRPELQAEARSALGVDATHTGILRAEASFAALDAALEPLTR